MRDSRDVVQEEAARIEGARSRDFAARMEFRILGPLEVVADGHRVEVRGEKRLALLAALLVRANEVVPQDVLVDDLWGEDAPAAAVRTLQSHIARLRSSLAEARSDAGHGILETHGPGYRLRVGDDQLDATRFAALVAEGLRARDRGDFDLASRLLHDALSLWRGPALADFAYLSFAQAEIARLDSLRLVALEGRIDADLGLGRHAELVGELESLVTDHPLRERLRAQLMLALYRSGRQAEALEVYQGTRRALVDGLGLEPGQKLRELEGAILRQDPSLDVAPVAFVDAGARPAATIRVPATSFVGRKRDLREVRRLLTSEDVRLLTLTGPAGTGKTRLALEAAAPLGDEFPDGVVLVELAPIADHARVASAMADALELGGLRGTDPVDAVVGFLRSRRMLIVLDNFEHVLGAASVVSRVLDGAPGVTVLATSRAPLRAIDETIYAVQALELPNRVYSDVARLRRTEAVRLFVDRARDVRAEFALTDANTLAVSELCVRLDGLPLALELAAARVRILAPDEILARLRARLEPLRASPGAGLPERHQTLRAAIAWSCDLLTAQELELFASLAIFAGGFTLKGAEEVANQPDIDLVGAIEALLEHNLLKVERAAGGEPRFGMLETVREFGLERLEEHGHRNAVRQRHAMFYLRLAEEAEPALQGPDQLEWLERLDAERDNVRAALSWAAENNEPDVGLRIAGSLWRYWQFRSSDREGRDWLEGLLAGRAGDEATRARAQARVASLAFVHGDHEAVCRYIEASLPILRRVGLGREVVSFMGLLATSTFVLGDGERALALAEEALALSRDVDDPMAKAYGFVNAGVVYAGAGRLSEARRHVEEGLWIARAIGNLRSVANWSRSLGGLALAQGEFGAARRLFEESLVLHQRLGDRWGISHSLSGLALLAQEEGDGRSARRFLAESFTIEREVDDRPGLVTNCAVAARLAAAERHRERATHLYAFLGTLQAASHPRTNSRVMGYAQGHPTEHWPDSAPQIAELEVALGEAAFADAWAAGQALTLDEAIALALEEPDPPPGD